MPSALETLVKILKLEREQGCNDTAVIGGLAKFTANWVHDAHTQARKPEHHLLVDELQQLVQTYAQTESRTERSKQIQYMLDRITGRVPPPPEFQVASPAAAAEAPPPAARQPERERRPEPPVRPPRQPQPVQNRKPAPEQARKPHKPEPNRPPQRQTDGFASDDDLGSGPRSPSMRLDVPRQPRLARPPRSARPQVKPEEALDILRGLRKPVTVVKGVGERMAESFKRLNVETLDDLLYFLPRRYDDYTRLDYISQLQPNTTATIIGTVREASVKIGQNNRKDFHLMVDDGSGLLDVTFFGRHFMTRYIKPQQQLVLSGPVTIFRNRIQMSNPEWEHLDTDNLHTIGIVPVYRLPVGF